MPTILVRQHYAKHSKRANVYKSLVPQIDTESNNTGAVLFTTLEAMAALYNGYYVTIPDLEGSYVSSAAN